MADAEFTTEERWRPVVGYEGVYSVSDAGRVRRDLTSKGSRGGRILLPFRGTDGYNRVTLHYLGARQKVTVHHLVMGAFVGPRAVGIEVNHADGIKTDNRLANLEYVTPKENCAHAIRTGLHVPLVGDNRVNAKLTNGQAAAIYRRHLRGERSMDLAEEFGVARCTVAHIVGGRGWNHVTGLPRRY